MIEELCNIVGKIFDWTIYFFFFILIILIILNGYNKPNNFNSCYSPKITSNLYHGIYPGGFSGTEDDFSELDVLSYEKRVEKKASFIYFSHNWFKSHKFPKEMVDWIYARGSIPYIRLMLRSNNINQGFNEKTYSLKRINSGALDIDLIDWFSTAAQYKAPMFVEYGIEVNGEWFPWNGTWNGKERGPEAFKGVYRHLIELSRVTGASNILWSFHLDSNEYPLEDWNKFENYYPGDNYIDLFTVSVYGMLTPLDIQKVVFANKFNNVYPRMKVLSKDKPIIVIEFGSTLDNPNQDQAEWARESLNSIFSGRWEGLIGFSWWNEFWHNKAGVKSTTMRVQDNPALVKVFKDTFNKYNPSEKLEFDYICK
jgi:hypothetical protein